MHNYKQNEKVMKSTIYRYMSPTDKNRHIYLNIYKKNQIWIKWIWIFRLINILLKKYSIHLQSSHVNKHVTYSDRYSIVLIYSYKLILLTNTKIKYYNWKILIKNTKILYNINCRKNITILTAIILKNQQQ